MSNFGVTFCPQILMHETEYSLASLARNNNQSNNFTNPGAVPLSNDQHEIKRYPAGIDNRNINNIVERRY